ncbi:(+)-neomenthol dehydrogenase [Coffea arabica]|uniref:Short-chain dehydrogenase/reductase n=1 Tax=Coffea arabica TaxID=13443 RepID=A0A6P6W2E1_COFAR
MAEAKRYAIVTGANKGIGFEVCRHLASKGITVVLTARDEKRGLDALHKLKFSDGLSADHLLFHQLDVADSSSVASLAQFIKTQFGRLDILVNNAGIIGADIDSDAFKAAIAAGAVEEERANKADWSSSIKETHELAVQCFQTNYYGAKRMIEAFVPLLQLSQSPRVVNVSSGAGKLKNIPSEWARGIFTDVDNLTEERVDEVLNQYLKDLKEGSREAKGWPSFLSSYTVSKAAMNAYTIVVAKKHPHIKINTVCPGFVKTDINFESGTLTAEEGADSIVRLALLPDDGPSGLFFIRSEISPLG